MIDIVPLIGYIYICLLMVLVIIASLKHIILVLNLEI
nr:MAG TPA: hypothetical protein [Crassvirales sp.]